ncbi:hypothetical protein ACFL6B_00415 [Thermodesulfobacteriota bacterium]
MDTLIAQTDIIGAPTKTTYPRQTGWLFMSPGEWVMSLGVAISIAALLFSSYSDISWWIGFGIILTVLSTINIAFSACYMLPYPQLAIVISCIQMILAAWGNWHFPQHHPVHDILDRLPAYLSYGGPACALFALGLMIPIGSSRLQTEKSETVIENQQTKKQLVKELHTIFLIGVAATLLGGRAPSSLRFIMVLLGNLMYVGAFGYILLNTPGWKSRTIIAMALLFWISLGEAKFHEMVIWGTFTVLVVAYRHKWNRKRLIAVIMAGVIGIVLVNAVKKDFRDQFWYGKEYFGENRFLAYIHLTSNYVLNPKELFSEEMVSELMVRFNQGWIINRAMIWTPAVKPFAHGKTIGNSITSALVPRILNPQKGVVSGREDYTRYTGLLLIGTSMSLGYAGEMYVNFGPRWGLLGIGLYALLLGLGFRWFYEKAYIQPLWWIWAGYFGIIAIKAETSVGFMINWMIKSVVIMLITLWIAPGMRRVLAPRMSGIRIKL